MKPFEDYFIIGESRRAKILVSLGRKNLLFSIFLSLLLLVLVGCTGAPATIKQDFSRPPAERVDTTDPSIGEPGEPSPAPAVIRSEAAKEISQQTAEPIEPTDIPFTPKPTEESESASPDPTGPTPVSSDVSLEATQFEPESPVPAEETAADVASPPVPEPVQAPAADSEDPSPQTSLPTAPGFTLTSATGEPVSLETYRGESNVVLVFFRGFW